MTQKEFEERTGIKLTEEEFKFINNLYINCSMEKDEFCNEYKKVAGSKLLYEIQTNLEASQEAIRITTEKEKHIADFLISKSRVYSDTDFRKMAERLVGEKEVVTRTLEMGIQLWEEDIEYIKSKL